MPQENAKCTPSDAVVQSSECNRQDVIYSRRPLWSQQLNVVVLSRRGAPVAPKGPSAHTESFLIRFVYAVVKGLFLGSIILETDWKEALQNTWGPGRVSPRTMLGIRHRMSGYQLNIHHTGREVREMG